MHRLLPCTLLIAALPSGACVSETHGPPGYAVGGAVTGLLGAGLVLRMGSEALPVRADGAFRFSTAMPPGSAFQVVVQAQPRSPVQLCTVVDGSGVIGSSDALSVSVTCRAQLLYFVVSGGAAELWRSDGTAAGTRPVLEALPDGGAGSDAVILGSLGSRLLFAARRLAYPGPTQRSLWVTDGTAAGTRSVEAVEPSGGLLVIGDVAYFAGSEDGADLELWRTDGTESGTYRVADIAGGPSGSDPRGLAALGELVFFSADDGVHGREPWVSDGTSAGTRLVADIAPGAEGGVWPHWAPTALAGSLYFLADGGSASSTGVELWRSDGTTAGTRRVRDLNPGPGNGVDLSARRGTVYGGRLWLAGDDGAHGFEVWSTDGTDAGTAMLLDAYQGLAPASPSGFVAAGSSLFYLGYSDAAGFELWRTDGTAAGTALVRDINPGPSGALLGELTPIGALIYFEGDDGVHGPQPWRSDGTVTGTVMLGDLGPSPYGSRPHGFVAFGDEVYFGATDRSGGITLWQTDGSAAGTSPVLEVCPAPCGPLEGLTTF